MAVTELYQKMIAAEEAEKAADYAIPEQKVYLALYKQYWEAVAKERAEWNAMPDGDAKDSAITNAYDTEDTDIDELRWFEIAFATYEEYNNSLKGF